MTKFQNISASENQGGGCMLFKGNSSMVQNRFYAYNCFNNNSGRGAVCQIYLSNGCNGFNYLHEDSVFNCGIPGKSDSMIWLYYGHIDVKLLNSSWNKASHSACYGLQSSPFYGYTSYCNFCHNTATGGKCMIYHEIMNRTMQYCNILNNNYTGNDLNVINYASLYVPCICTYYQNYAFSFLNPISFAVFIPLIL